MKFIWESNDVVPGRKLRTHGNIQFFMIFADDKIGGGSRFGLLDLQHGRVIAREQTTPELADYINQMKFEPLPETPNDED